MTARVPRDAMAAAAVVLLALLVRIPTLMQPLLEAHDFRQTQTAYTAILFSEQGIDLLRPEVPVLGPPFLMAWELPLFQALATIPMGLGLAPDAAMRLTALASAIVAAVVLWWLVRHLAGPIEAFAALVCFLFSPLAMLWTRTSMIEYLVIAAALGYLGAGTVWRDTRRPAWWLVAVVSGTIAMTVKSTSGFFWVLPLVAYAPAARARRLDAWLAALVAIPLALGLAWTQYADAMRAAGPGTAWMTSTRLAPWLFGPLEERLSSNAWVAVLAPGLLWAIGPSLLPILAAIPRAVRASAQPRFWTVLLVAPLASILIFFNLYSAHDYYILAATPVFAIGLGLASGHLVRTRGVGFVRFSAVVGACCAFAYLTLSYITQHVAGAAAIATLAVLFTALLVWLALWARAPRERLVAGALAIVTLVNVSVTADYWGRAYQPIRSAIPALAAELDRFTAPTDEVVVVGLDWSPSLLYYARRRGQMLPPALLEPSFVASLPTARYSTLVASDPDSDPLWPSSPWPWIGALGVHTYALGSSLDQLRGATLVATADAGAFERAAAMGKLLAAQPVVVRCGDRVTIPTGISGTWLRLADTGADARIRVAQTLAPVPARGVVAFATGRGTSLSCEGADTVTIAAIVDAPLR